MFLIRVPSGPYDKSEQTLQAPGGLQEATVFLFEQSDAVMSLFYSIFFTSLNSFLIFSPSFKWPVSVTSLLVPRCLEGAGVHLAPSLALSHTHTALLLCMIQSLTPSLTWTSEMTFWHRRPVHGSPEGSSSIVKENKRVRYEDAAECDRRLSKHTFMSFLFQVHTEVQSLFNNAGHFCYLSMFGCI